DGGAEAADLVVGRSVLQLERAHSQAVGRVAGDDARAVKVAGHRVRARAGGRVAHAGMAAVAGRADHGRPLGAGAGHAGVGLGAGVAVVAGGAVGEGRVRAGARSRVAGPRAVALVGRRAGDRDAAALAGAASVGLGAGVAVVA